MYIFGDSFLSAEKYGRDQERTWWYRLARQLGCDGFENRSVIGSSQEFLWSMLHSFVEQMKPEDYLLISITHPGRRWWWQEDPSLGRPEFVRDIVNIDPKIADTAELWERYIQRPVMDIIPHSTGMAWLAYQVYKRKLRRPVVLMAFEQVTPFIEQYDELNIAKGFMTEHVANLEIINGSDATMYNKIIQGHDPRYNHMCLTNHDIMIEKALKSYSDGTPIDLTSGFKTGIITNDTLKDPEFIQRELDPVKAAERSEKIKQRTVWNRFKAIGKNQIK